MTNRCDYKTLKLGYDSMTGQKIAEDNDLDHQCDQGDSDNTQQYNSFPTRGLVSTLVVVLSVVFIFIPVLAVNIPRKDYNLPWWYSGVIYHIYPKSFQDSNGDGIGDINGESINRTSQ